MTRSIYQVEVDGKTLYYCMQSAISWKTSIHGIPIIGVLVLVDSIAKAEQLADAVEGNKHEPRVAVFPNRCSRCRELTRSVDDNGICDKCKIDEKEQGH